MTALALKLADVVDIEDLRAAAAARGLALVPALADRDKTLSNSNEYRTPRPMFLARHQRFAFTVDLAAARWNAQLPEYFTRRQNVLRLHPRGRGFLNPPYKGEEGDKKSAHALHQFLGWARQQVELHRLELVDCLVPSYPCERWWLEHVRMPAGRMRPRGYDTWETDLGGGIGLARVDRWRWDRLTIEVATVRRRIPFQPNPAELVRLRNRKKATSGARFGSAFVTYFKPEAYRGEL